jgi:hypothetical protein
MYLLPLTTLEDMRQIKNQESQNQTASINLSSREDFQTIIDQMVDDAYCSNLVNESTDSGSKSDEKWENLMGFNENLDSHDEVPETDMPIYPGHRMTVYTSMMLILLYTVCHFYCKSCMTCLNGDEEICPNEKCGTNLKNLKDLIRKQYFIEIPIESQLLNILKRHNTLSLLKRGLSGRRKMKQELRIFMMELYTKNYHCLEDLYLKIIPIMSPLHGTMMVYLYLRAQSFHFDLFTW